MAIIGSPFLACFVGLLFALRPHFRRAPGAFLKILWGMALTLTGALGLETSSNFVAVDSAPGVLQSFAEEMCEMVGSTVVLWGSYELLCRQGVTVRFGTGDAGSSVEGRVLFPRARIAKRKLIDARNARPFCKQKVPS